MYSKDGGTTAVHEELHNWGLGDYYADVAYLWTMVDNATKKVVSEQTTYPATGGSVSYEGYEGTIMASGGGLKLHQNNILLQPQRKI
jgi:hypothetical protein